MENFKEANNTNVYLDNAATTPLSQNMKNYLKDMLDVYGNPSSAHSVGKKSRQIIENARDNVRKFINADPNESDISFTSGGSASNTLAIRGFIDWYCKSPEISYLSKISMYYSPTLHKSALKLIDDISCKKNMLKVLGDGKIDLNNFKQTIESSKYMTLNAGTHRNQYKFVPFVVIDYANSEIGTIQPVKEIIEIVHQHNGVVYVDCTGSILTTSVDVQELDADMIGFSGHKIGALKGTGVLYKKKNISLTPLIFGSQEQGLFGGTENFLGIASLGYAVSNYDYSGISTVNRDYVLNYLKSNIDGINQIGGGLPHNLFLCIKNVNGTALTTMMDNKYNIQLSTGSACNSGNKEHSLIMDKIGLSANEIDNCIRLSFSGQETKDELDYVCNSLKICIATLRKIGV